MRFALPLLLATLASAPAAQAQVIAGTLMDSESRTPLAAAVLTLLDPDSTVRGRLQTDSVGEFSFRVPRPGPYRLLAEHLGFRATTSPRLIIGSYDTLQVEFSLARDAVLLEPLVVKARSRHLTPAARRFYDRSRNSLAGSFITREDIDKSRVVRTTELLRRVPGIRIYPITGGNVVTVRGTCRPTVYVDGNRVHQYRSIDDLAQPLELEGVEVYRSADQAPAEYTGLQAGCAAILIWTRIE